MAVYSAGSANDFLELCVLNLIKELSVLTDYRIYGSIVPFIAKKIFGGNDPSRFNYFQTVITQNNHTYTCQRSINIITTIDQESHLLNFLRKIGTLRIIQSLQPKYNPIYIPKGIKTIRHTKLIISSDVICNPSFLARQTLFHVYKLYNELHLNINITICNNLRALSLVPIYYLSDRFCISWNPNTQSFSFGSLTDGPVLDFTQSHRLENYIESVMYYSLYYNSDAPPNHTVNGDKLPSEDQFCLQTFDQCDNPDKCVYNKLIYVLNGGDIMLNKIRRIKFSYLNYTDNCAYCQDSFQYKPIYKCACGHIFHLGCLATGLLIYYNSLLYASINKTGIINYDVYGNVLTDDIGGKCIMCRTPNFCISIPKEKLDGWVISNKDERKTPFLIINDISGRGRLLKHSKIRT